MKNYFFKKKKGIKINDILHCLNLKKQKKNFNVNDIKDLEEAEKDDITFIHSKKYIAKIECVFDCTSVKFV